MRNHAVGSSSSLTEPAPLEAVLERSRALGFLGPGEIAAHIQHALRFLDTGQLEGAVRALDLGSGGGVPGLVLAHALPSSSWVLLDASARRTAFLREAVDALALGTRVTVVEARAEDAGRDPALRGRFDVVVARSFGPPPSVAEAAAPLLRVGGTLVVSEPPGEQTGGRWPAAGVAEVGLEAQQSLTVGSRFFVARQVTPCPARFPRRWAAQRRRPLYVVPRETLADGST